METSALKGEGVEAVFAKAAQEIIKILDLGE